MVQMRLFLKKAMSEISDLCKNLKLLIRKTI
jgi:hypothetical protein